MSKRYIHALEDDSITDAAGLKAIADTNPAVYPVGGIYVLTNGVYLVISANDGTAVTVLTITAI